MNKVKLTKKIRTLEGLTNDEKAALIELLNNQKKYGLVWENKPEDVEEKLRNDLPVLKEVKERAIVSEDKDAPNHIIIEGDNLEALTALSYTHTGKIDVIYIDPPYNTGKNDFVYNDSYVDKEDGYKHSKWLSFMHKRLDIAHGLLSDNGVIFISIDDKEQAQLRLICDEIFGENNFVGTYFWKRTSTPPALSYKIRRKLEFVLCYQKTDIIKRTFAQGYVDGGDAPLLNSSNPVGTLSFPKGSVHFNIRDGIYSANNRFKINLLDDIKVVNGINNNEFRARGNFKWGQSNLNREVSDGTYFLIKSKQFSPRFQKSQKTTKVPSNIIDESVSVGTNEDAQKELSSFGLSISFDYAKPTSLISYLIKMPFWKINNITILDFFAGSGTTMHATMKLNEEDGGQRKCILVTNNENNICDEVTYIRNKKVIEGYTTPSGEKVDGLTNNNLRYYKTDFIPRDKTPRNMRKLVWAATDLLCIKNDIYTESSIAGKRLNEKIAKYFDNGKARMLVIYDERAIANLVELLKTVEPSPKIKVYVFAPGSYAFDDEFTEVADRIELCALPAAIYNTYKRVLPKRRPKYLPEALAEMKPAQNEKPQQTEMNFNEEGE
jgi:adenine-specific DNA-methyltransferase